jgi:pyruvate/2-oxoglutarate dehydrogenase complex dihydrolipoamide dehydrogenase (E3) component
VIGREMFTHAAGHEAVMAIRDAFFPGRAPTCALVSSATFTDPELASVGVTIEQAVAAHGARHVHAHRCSLAHNDRAQTDVTQGAIVLVEHSRFWRRRLIGAHVLAPGAGELIGELAMAIHQRLSVSDLGGIIHVYPTIATSIQQLGGQAALDQALKYRWLMRIRGRR